MSFKRLQRALFRTMAAVVALAILFCIGLYGYRTMFGYTYDSSLSDEDLAASVTADENITNIALFGLDTREGDKQSHSDCMMIVTVDNTRGKIKLISLMRDSLVDIDGYGEDKLNAAYFRGGPSLAIRTINENFGTDIKDYVAVDFEQLVQIVDAIGGVEKTGLQTLDGVQALCYGRIRKGDTGDDWARVERQSVVLNAIFTKLQSASATELIGSMRKLVPYVTTSLSPTDMASLIVGAVKNGIPTLEHTRIPVDGEWSYSGNSSEFITYDLDVAADHIHAYIYDDADIGSGTTDDDTGTDSKSDTDTRTDTTDSSKSTDTKSNTTAVDPESLVEEGGWYDSDTGDYYDCDGDRYSLDENGNKVYY